MKKNIQQTQSPPFILSFSSNHRRTTQPAVSDRIPMHHKVKQSSNQLSELFYEKHSQVTDKTNYKKNQDRFKAIVQRYKQIEKILISENENLKQQNKYLTDCLHKTIKNQKMYQQKMHSAQQRQLQQNNFITQLQQDLVELKEYIRENIQNLNVLIKADNIRQLKSVLRQFVAGMTDILCLKKNDQKQTLFKTDPTQQGEDCKIYLSKPKNVEKRQKVKFLIKESDDIENELKHLKKRESPKKIRFHSQSACQNEDRIPHQKSAPFKLTVPTYHISKTLPFIQQHYSPK